MGLDLAVATAIVVTLLQVFLLALLALLRDRHALRACFAVVIGATTIESAASGLAAWRGTLPPIALLQAMELTVALGLLFAACMTPVRVRWAGATTLRTAWLAATGVSIVAMLGLPAAGVVADGGAVVTAVFPHAWYAVLALVMATLLAHTLPAWRRLAVGPLSVQTLVVMGAIALGPMFVAASAATGEGLAAGPAGWALALTGTAFLALVVARAVREPSVGHLSFAALIAGAATLGALDGIRGMPAVDGFGAQALRPLLLALALVRFGAFSVTRRLRTAAGPLAAVLFSCALFAFVTAGIHNGTPPIEELSTTTAALGAITVALVAVFLAPALVRDVFGPSPLNARAKYYVLQAQREAILADDEGSELPVLRERLGITADEHEMAMELAARGGSVPTWAALGLMPGDIVAGRYRILRRLPGLGRRAQFQAVELGGTSTVVVMEELARPGHALAPADRRAAEVRIASLERADGGGNLVPFAIVDDGGWTLAVRPAGPGRTLTDVIDAGGPLDPKDGAGLARAICVALDRLHQAGVAHGRLAPELIEVDPRGGWSVVVPAVPRKPGPVPRDRTATRVGPEGATTAGWTTPEEVTGAAPDSRSDIHAAAAIVAFALTGDPGAGRGGDHIPLPEISPVLARWLGRALSEDPGRRYLNAAGALAALGAEDGSVAAH